MTLSKRVRAADVEDGVKPEATEQLVELLGLKRRNRLLEQETTRVLRTAVRRRSGRGRLQPLVGELARLHNSRRPCPR
jgi:hypothetical protein